MPKPETRILLSPKQLTPTLLSNLIRQTETTRSDTVLLSADQSMSAAFSKAKSLSTCQSSTHEIRVGNQYEDREIPWPDHSFRRARRRYEVIEWHKADITTVLLHVRFWG
jgi:hypothetical protein